MSELKRCPFCDITLIADGNKFFVHPVVGCLLDGIPIKNDTESIKRWNTRKPMDRIVERLEEERALLKEERKEAIEYDDEQIIFATNNQIRAFDYSLRVIKEEGGINDNT